MVRPIADDPARFTEDMLTGFVAANPQYVRAVPGGVVRAASTRPGKVAVVVGGGSGHYPAFCGVVGPGFADGAVVGNVFTSPSTTDVLGVVRGCATDAGAVVLTGNYAGDVMNFTLAETELNASGIPTRYLVVTDDIASAPPEDAARRRGIAGDFPVFKIAAALAEEGAELDAVVEIAERANAATRTLGVAFDGCTMPGTGEPLFTVPGGTMGLGVGIHGEPGIGDALMPTATELATLLVERLLAETPPGASARVAPILNGLGRTKYEELFVLWGRVLPLLEATGLTIVGPQVGELVTSLDMAGCSLTLTWLDDDLERLWLAPCDTPAFRLAPGEVGKGAQSRGAAGGASAVAVGEVGTEPVADDGIPGGVDDDGAPPAAPARADVSGRTRGSSTSAAPAASRADLAAAPRVVDALSALDEALRRAETELGDLDAVAGDGDHGRGMVRGVGAALEAARSAVDDGTGARGALDAAGAAWADRAGGTSGVLWGAMLRAVADRLELPVTLDGIAAAFRAGVDTVATLGGAKAGDKTMLDVALPVAAELELAASQGATVSEALDQVDLAARAAAAATADLAPRIGRARPLAARSVGTADPGAVSFALAVTAVGRVLAHEGSGRDSDDHAREGTDESADGGAEEARS